MDHIPCLQAWAESLGGINYPLVSDFWPHGAVSELYGVLRQVEGHSERAIFVIDKQGYIRYIDIHDIDQQPDNDVLRSVLRSLEPPSITHQPVPALVEEELPKGGIVLYCARWCKDCKRARAWLEERGLAFAEVDIDYNMTARSQLRKWANGAIITPAFDIYGTVVLDFNEKALEAALKKAADQKTE